MLSGFTLVAADPHACSTHWTEPHLVELARSRSWWQNAKSTPTYGDMDMNNTCKRRRTRKFSRQVELDEVWRILQTATAMYREVGVKKKW